MMKRVPHRSTWRIDLARADLPLLMKRVTKRADRPLLRADDPEQVMRGLIDERYPVYAQADITIDSRDVQHTQMVNEVIKAPRQVAGLEQGRQGA